MSSATESSVTESSVIDRYIREKLWASLVSNQSPAYFNTSCLVVIGIDWYCFVLH
jgi:hypothetical protein